MTESSSKSPEKLMELITSTLDNIKGDLDWVIRWSKELEGHVKPKPKK